MPPTIAVINESTVLEDGAIAQVVAALQIQVSRDFAPVWGGLDATLLAVPRGASPPAGAWQLAVMDRSDVAGDLGYHELTAEGLPLGKVFAADDMADGLGWSVTLSHELLEMLVDPQADQYVLGRDGKQYAREVCDPCEDDQFGYLISGVRASDFAFPEYFGLVQIIAHIRFDQTGALTSPLPWLATGGYQSSYDPAHPEKGWTQTFGQQSPHDRGRLPRGFHRRKLRAIPHAQRRRSVRWQAPPP